MGLPVSESVAQISGFCARVWLGVFMLLARNGESLTSCHHSFCVSDEPRRFSSSQTVPIAHVSSYWRKLKVYTRKPSGSASMQSGHCMEMQT